MQSHTNLASKHLSFMHGSASGWISMAKKDPHTNYFRQYHYTIEELEHHLAEWSGENVYFSQNTFYKPKRAIDTIRELRSIYVDVDTYTKGLNPQWVLGKLEYEYFGQSLPVPNLTLMSGRGLVLVWNIEPVPYKALPLWKAVENHFIDVLKDLGADTKASDPTRIFRLAGTINSKNGATVTAEYLHEYRYELRQLQYDYLPELTPSQSTKRRGRKPKIIHLFNVYTLHLSRTMDIAKLIDIRNGDVGNCREMMCFLYRYWTCCYSNDPQQALEETIALNNEFTRPLEMKEVVRATKSAEKAWSAKSSASANKIAQDLGYRGAGYNLKNETIINWLDITEEEQMHLSTIIGRNEKRRRNTNAKRSQRREQGMVEREQYLLEQKKKSDSKLDILRLHLQDNPKIKNVEVAKLMGVSESYIRKLKKQL